MLATLKAVWGQNRRLVANFLSLSVLQFANYLVPLITLPYLFRVLGPPKYGLIEFARAISVYSVILTDYGFNLSATREISVHRDDPPKISEIFSSVMALKTLLTVASFLALALLILTFARLRDDWPVYVLTFGAVVGQCLFPVWLFQGLERMKYIAVITVTAKSLVVVAISVFIKNAADYLYVPLLQSVASHPDGARRAARRVSESLRPPPASFPRRPASRTQKRLARLCFQDGNQSLHDEQCGHFRRVHRHVACGVLCGGGQASLSGPFSFVFIDCDLHDSMLCAARTLWPSLSVGGCYVSDDHANDSFGGATKAIDAFVCEQGRAIGERGPLADKLYFAYKSDDGSCRK